jgi:hypothetical protein
VLQCKFEQTDAGADEAVSFIIVKMDSGVDHDWDDILCIQPTPKFEAFKTPEHPGTISHLMLSL